MAVRVGKVRDLDPMKVLPFELALPFADTASANGNTSITIEITNLSHPDPLPPRDNH
jgi:hypothetical protein